MKPELLARRVAALEAAFRQVQATRMAGVPVLNARLQVRAVGFAAIAAEPEVGQGVLVTPWFMNLVRLPLSLAAGEAMLKAGHKARRDLGQHSFEYIGAYEEALGVFEACSLFSPMLEFSDQNAATATAEAVLQHLHAPAALARRGFLFGRAREVEDA